MKKILAWLFLASFCVLSFAEGRDVSANIIESSASFVMTSPTTATYTVKKRVLVQDAKGEEAALVVIYNDYSMTLTSFSGYVLSAGKKQKLSMNSLTYTEYSSNLADDSKYYIYSPDARFPYELYYEYEVSFKKGIVTFPSFTPIVSAHTSLDSDATYSLTVPKGLEIEYNSCVKPIADKSSPKFDKYLWTFPKNEGYVEEDYMPEFRKYGSYLYACPATFTYGGIQGSQKNWSDFGSWMNSLQEGCVDLPDDFKAKVKDMTKDCTSDYQRVKCLYNYLADNTRYVSIQLGIGGLKSIPASRTLKTGYGDCKSLSTFLKAMLEAIGIQSECVIVNTDDKDILPGCSSISQMNHMMLCVPLKSDTLWVECTNPHIPLGYRHGDIAGHDVILVSDKGGKMVRVPEYNPDLRRETNSYNVTLSADGSASCKLEAKHYLDLSEPYYTFKSLPPEKQEIALTKYNKFRHTGFKVISVTNNFSELDHLEHVSLFCPEVTLCANMTAMNYAKVSGNRIFVPLNPMSQTISTSRSKRVNEICIYQTQTSIDSMKISIPVGYEVEATPSSVSLNSTFGCFNSTVTKDGQYLIIIQKLTVKMGDYPASSYDDFRSFGDAISKAYDSVLILKHS